MGFYELCVYLIGVALLLFIGYILGKHYYDDKDDMMGMVWSVILVFSLLILIAGLFRPNTIIFIWIAVFYFLVAFLLRAFVVAKNIGRKKEYAKAPLRVVKETDTQEVLRKVLYEKSAIMVSISHEAILPKSAEGWSLVDALFEGKVAIKLADDVGDSQTLAIEDEIYEVLLHRWRIDNRLIRFLNKIFFWGLKLETEWDYRVEEVDHKKMTDCPELNITCYFNYRGM